MYGYDVQGSVSQLVDRAGQVKAAYGYTPYGSSDSSLTSQDTSKNPYGYTAKRFDVTSGTLDMGARRFGPDIAHFLQQDFYADALSDIGLSNDPLTQNRYDLAGGNPVSFVEVDGHRSRSMRDEYNDVVQWWRQHPGELESYYTNVCGGTQWGGCFTPWELWAVYNSPPDPWWVQLGMMILIDPEALPEQGVAAAGRGIVSRVFRKIFGRSEGALSKAAKRVAQERLPAGFANVGQFAESIKTIGKVDLGEDAMIGIRGSSATGRSFREGIPFGPHSDIDFFVVSDKYYEKALQLGIRPQKPGVLKVGHTLNFPELRKAELRLEAMLGHVSHIRIYSRAGYRRFIHRSTDILVKR